jgi:hypothetical protein
LITSTRYSGGRGAAAAAAAAAAALDTPVAARGTGTGRSGHACVRAWAATGSTSSTRVSRRDQTASGGDAASCTEKERGTMEV